MGADDALDFDKCILGQPNPACWLVKRYFQHAFHKKTKTGKGIFIVRMRKRPFQYEVFTDHDRAHGFLDVANNAGNLGVEPVMCTKHMMFLHDFCFNEIDSRPPPEGRFIRICDVGQVNLWSLGPSAITFFIQMLAPLPPTYQARVEKVFIVNANTAFSVFLSLCSSVFTQKFLDTIACYGSWETERLHKDLLELIDAECLPVEFGGTCACEGEGGCWKNAPEELLFMKMMAESTPVEQRIGEKAPASPPPKEEEKAEVTEQQVKEKQEEDEKPAEETEQAKEEKEEAGSS